jgi:hypothetical protein
VEVTLDGGETWQVCDLDHPERPTKYGKYWCWCSWSVDVEVLDLMGAKEIAVRAWDEALNTQPEKLIWNPSPVSTVAPPVSTVALANLWEKVLCRLVGKKLGLPVGKHVYVRAFIDDKLCMRAYTPTSSVEEVGHVELLIKIYFKDEDPKFPAGGLLSQYLDSLPLGAPVSIKGPVGHIEYNGRGSFTV